MPTTRYDPITGRPVREEAFDPAGFEQEVEAPRFRLLDVDDVLLAIPRGLEGLGRSVADLAGGVFGQDFRFSENRSELLGRSDTVIGGFLEGAAQFALPFAGARGLLSLSGALSRTSVPLVRGLGLMTGAKGQIARGLVAGAAADLVAFGGHEENLSNLLTKVPGLQGTVATYLAIDEDDSELEGRIKNVLEGAGVGAVFDAILGGLRGIKRGRRAIANAKTPEEAAAAVRRTRKEVEAETKEALEALRDSNRAFERQVEESVPPGERPRDLPPDPESTELPLKRIVELGLDTAPRLREAFNLDTDDVSMFVERFEKMAADGIYDYLGPDVDVRKLPKDVRAFLGMADAGVLDPRRLGKDLDAKTYALAVERYLENNLGALRSRRSDAETLASALQQAREMLGNGAGAWIEIDRQLQEARGIETLPMLLHGYITQHASRASLAARLSAGVLVRPDILRRAGLDGLTELELFDVVIESNKNLQYLTAAKAELGGSAGRTLRNFQRTGADIAELLGDAVGAATDGADLVNRVGLEEARKRVAGIGLLGDLSTPAKAAAAARFAKLTAKGKILAASTEWMISSMLWSGRTVVTNGIFPLLTSVSVPLENMVGGIATLNGSAVMREVRSLQHMVASMGEAARAFGAAVRSGRSNVDPTAARALELGIDQSLLDPEIMRAAGVTGLGPGTIGGWVIGQMGKVASVPTRLMSATDDAIKTFTSRGYNAALLHEEALRHGADPTTYIAERLPKMYDEGQIVSEDLVKKRVQERVEAAIAEGARPEDINRGDLLEQVKGELSFDELNPITAQGLARAREVTATGPLEGSGVIDTAGRAVQQFVGQLPALRLVLPFVRTPANIAKFAIERNPILQIPALASAVFKASRGGVGGQALRELSQRNARDLLSNDRILRSQAVGRLLTGTGIVAAVTMHAQSGNITGGGPRDPELRRQLQDAGWAPYSIRVGNKYIQYLRADPFATMIGLAADVVESYRMASAEGNTENEAIALGLIQSVVRNITDKTYMTGFRTLMDTLADPLRGGGQLIASLGGATIPRAATQLRDVLSDPVDRDTYGLVAKLQQRLPYFGDRPPARNMFGEPIKRTLALGANADTPASLWLDMFLPITYREVADDGIRKEMANLQHGFNPPPRERAGIRPDDFTNGRQDAYDRWAQLHGEVKVNGRTMKSALRRLFDSSAYQALPIQGTEYESSPRVREVRRIINRYRDVAWEQVLREYPELDQAYRARLGERRRLRLGDNVQSLIDADPFRIR